MAIFAMGKAIYDDLTKTPHSTVAVVVIGMLVLANQSA
jgi:hypothetical protein